MYYRLENAISIVKKNKNFMEKGSKSGLYNSQFSKYQYIFIFLQFSVGQQLSGPSIMELPETRQVQGSSEVLHSGGCTT